MKKYIRNNMNLFDKIEWIKQLATDTIGVSNEIVLRKILRRLARKGTSQIKKFGISKLSQQELVLDQVLKDNEISPRTAYNWFLYSRVPKDVYELGQNGEISQNEIKRRSGSLRSKPKPEQEILGKEIIQEVIKIMGMM